MVFSFDQIWADYSQKPERVAQAFGIFIASD